MGNKLSKVVSDMPSASPMPMTAEQKKRERRYRAEDAMRTLARANEIRKDAELMAEIAALAKEQMKTLKEFA